ncbi:MAG: hypothetical protein K2X82_05260 [Gemmataceae bacterium]|nr:hypothetical protein [Gemmataceae bacterium]
MDADRPPNRIGLFALGATFAGCGGLAAWIAFTLLTAMMDPTLTGAAYRQEVRNRAVNNPALTVGIALAGAGVVAGVTLMMKAVVRKPHHLGVSS